MLKLLHVVAIGALIGSAGYAYSIKYEATFAAEDLQRLRKQAQKEREAIAVLRAEWQHLNRPERLQALAERHLSEMQPLSVTQITRWQDIPMRGPKADSIGRKLEDLGMGDIPTSSITPAQPRPATTTKPQTAGGRP